MGLRLTLLILVWMAFVAIAALIGLRIVRMRGLEGTAFAVVVVLGALALGGSLLLGSSSPGSTVLAIGGIAMFVAGCLGLVPPRTRRGHCPGCGYDLRGETDSSTVCCPECGRPKPGKEGFCHECGADIRNAIAGGTIKCPHCGQPVRIWRDR